MPTRVPICVSSETGHCKRKNYEDDRHHNNVHEAPACATVHVPVSGDTSRLSKQSLPRPRTFRCQLQKPGASLQKPWKPFRSCPPRA